MVFVCGFCERVSEAVAYRRTPALSPCGAVLIVSAETGLLIAASKAVWHFFSVTQVWHLRESCYTIYTNACLCGFII